MTIKSLLALLAVGLTAVFAETTVSVGKMAIRESKVHAGNVLPSFLFTQGTVEGGGTQVILGGGKGTLRPFTPDDSVGDDIWDGAMDDVRSPQLPYLTQDQWGCEREDTEIDVVVLENEFLKVQIAPSVGGKIWSAYDKVNKEELVMNPTVHQPANIGALKAWAPGGIEFNFSPGIIGHSAFTESPTFVTKIDTEKGPMVRVYEYDRYNSTVWQVDILIDKDELWIYPRVTNPNDVDLRGYWWTCVAHTITPNSRVVAPADKCVETGVGALREAPWPYLAETWNASFSGLAPPLGNYVWKQDHSFIGNIVWGDYFLRLRKDQRKYIMHVDDNGYSVFHGHDMKLQGTKLFSWGATAPGRFMQDFMSGFPPNREGDYTELQVGPAPTQMQSWPLPKNSVYDWVEFFKGWKPTSEEKSALQHPDYAKAQDVTSVWINGEAGVPFAKENEMKAFFQQHAEIVPKDADILFKGMPWGGLHEKLRAKLGKPATMSKGALFSYDPKNWEVRPWHELLTDGTFSSETLRYSPQSYQVSDEWRQILIDSATTYGATWLHLLHLGIISTEHGFVEPSRNLFRQSMSLKPSAVAARNLALLCDSNECAFEYFQQAWALAVSNTKDIVRDRLLKNLAAEITSFFQSIGRTDAKWLDNLAEFLDAVEAEKTIPKEAKRTDQYITATIAVLIHQGHFEKALDILSSECFPTYGRARSELINYWNDANKKIREKELGRELTRREAHALRVEKPQPRNIGCPYASTYCLNYW